MSRSRIAELGALLGDATRAQLLTILQDGRASTVGELARAGHHRKAQPAHSRLGTSREIMTADGATMQCARPSPRCI
ncbi:MAG TPA: hypothetical protein VF951_04950, partial [Streptosporangiaceae bacterium]